MAKLYGGNSRYLIDSDLRNEAISIIFLLICTILFGLFIHYLSKFPLLYVFLFFAIVLPLMKILKRRSFFYQKVSRHFNQGFIGEEVLRTELLKLDDSYVVFQNLHAPGKKANIDFVVVGLTGIFVIEAKNISGNISLIGKQIAVNGKFFAQKDIIAEVTNEYWDLHKYLQDTLKTELFITPVLLFTNKYSAVRFGIEPVINGIHILGISWIRKFILSHPTSPRLVSNELIIDALKLITE